MKSSNKIRRALNFTKYTVAILRCWPPPRKASKLDHVIFDLSWWIMFISSLCLLFPLMASVYIYRNNTEIMTKSVCLFCATSQLVIKSIFCKIRRTKLQNIIEEMEDFISKTNSFEKNILEKYIDKCALLHLAVTIWMSLTLLSFIVFPVFFPQRFPCDAIYPFSLENILISVLIYAHQSLVAIQASCAVLLDCVVAAFIWFLCARFEILAVSIGDCKNFKNLRQYFERYQDLLRYTNDVRETVDLLVFATISTSVGGVLFSLIQLVSDQPSAIKGQFAVAAIAASVGLFTCSWAADSLLDKEYLVGVKAFHCKWYNMETRAKSCITHLILCSQKPLIIDAISILPTLSLEFYSQFLFTSFRFFTALRVMVE